MTLKKTPYSAIYQLTLGEDDARACKDIAENACDEQPKSFGVHVVAMALSKIGDGLSDVKLTLAWLMVSIGVPAGFIAWLVPVREALSLLPQLIIASHIRHYQKRKYFWVFGSAAQGLCIFITGVLSFFVTGKTAGWLIIALLTVFSLARSICSIAGKDVLGKTIAKQKRGRVNGLATSSAGLATFIFGALLILEWLPVHDARVLGGLLIIAGLLWFVAALVYSHVPEYPGATEGGQNGFLDAMSNLGILVMNKSLRHFLITRSLFISTALVAPFYVALANSNTDSGLATLGLMLLLAGLANLLSSPFWGTLADASSKKVLMLAGTICAVLAFVVCLAELLEWSVAQHPWWYALIIFTLYIGHAGIRLGRKTYLLDMANQDNRATLVAVSNTVIGVVLLVSGGLSTFAAQSGIVGAIMTFGVLSLCAVLCASRLEDVSR